MYRGMQVYTQCRNQDEGDDINSDSDNIRDNADDELWLKGS